MWPKLRTSSFWVYESDFVQNMCSIILLGSDWKVYVKSGKYYSSFTDSQPAILLN